MPLLSQQVHDSFAEALEDCTLCLMSRADVEHLVEAKPQVALNIIRLLAGRVRELEKLLEMQAFRSVRQRLTAAILRLADTEAELNAVSHQLLAETIGAARETVPRVVGEFQAAVVLEMRRFNILITNADGLRELARE